MKKVIMILALAASVLAFSACGNNKKAAEGECTECTECCEGECTKAEGEECCGNCADSTKCEAAADSTAVVAE